MAQAKNIWENEWKIDNIYFFAIVVTVIPTVAFSQDKELKLHTEIYISPEGSDLNPRTQTKPFATLEKARDNIRNTRSEGDSANTVVYLRGGTYKLERPFVLELQDSNVTYTAFGKETPVITVGKTIKKLASIKSGYF